MGVALAGGAAHAAGSALGNKVAGGKGGPDQFDAIAEIQADAIRRAEPLLQQGISAAEGIIRPEQQQINEDFQPFIERGTEALDFFSDLLGVSGDQEATQQAIAKFEASPFAQLQNERLAESQQALTRQFAGQGTLQSGNFADALQSLTGREVRRGLNEFGAQLGGLASAGQQGAAQRASLSSPLALGLAGLAQQRGQAAAERELGIGRAAAGAIQNRIGATGLFK